MAAPGTNTPKEFPEGYFSDFSGHQNAHGVELPLNFHQGKAKISPRQNKITKRIFHQGKNVSSDFILHKAQQTTQ